MPSGVVNAQTTVPVRPSAYKLSNTRVGRISGSSARFARPELPQKNSTVSPHSLPAAARARSTMAVTRGRIARAAGAGAGAWAAAAAPSAPASSRRAEALNHGSLRPATKPQFRLRGKSRAPIPAIRRCDFRQRRVGALAFRLPAVGARRGVFMVSLRWLRAAVALAWSWFALQRLGAAAGAAAARVRRATPRRST